MHVFYRMGDTDFIPDYEPDDDDLPCQNDDWIRGATQRHNKGRKCPLCPGRFINVRRHVVRSHLPWYMAPFTACWECKLQFGQFSLLDGHIKQFHNGKDRKFGIDMQECWVELVNGFLQAIQERLGCMSLSDLSALAGEVCQFQKNSEPALQDTDISAMSIYNSLNGFGIKDLSSLQLPYAYHSFLHWKILALLINKSDDKENLAVYENRRPFRKVTLKPVTISLIDSHFHLDMYLKKLKNDALPEFNWHWGETEYRISHVIANYCFPRNWPSSSKRSDLRRDRRIHMAMGIHPRIVAMENPRVLEKWMKELESLAKATRVVAIGECGLDTSIPGETDVRKQLRFFERQVQLASKLNLPIVIHCRGDTRLDEKCLNCMVDNLPQSHRVHRHCFDGDNNTYSRWKAAFPNCKFGISPFLILNDKYPNFRARVCAMEIKDIVLETDSPYLYASSDSFGSPLLLQDILTQLFGMFPFNIDELASITTQNCKELYNLE